MLPQLSSTGIYNATAVEWVRGGGVVEFVYNVDMFNFLKGNGISICICILDQDVR